MFVLSTLRFPEGGVCAGGGIPACLAGFQAHTQGGSLGGSGGVSRNTTKREVEGDLASGGLPALSWVSAPGGICSWGCGDPPVTATAAGGTHPTGMHSCFQYFHHKCRNTTCAAILLYW